MEFDGQLAYSFWDASSHRSAADKPIIDRVKRMVRAYGHAGLCPYMPEQASPQQWSRLSHSWQISPSPPPSMTLSTSSAQAISSGVGLVKLFPQQHLPMGCFHNWIIGMPQGYGAKPHAILDEFIAVNIPNMATFTSDNKSGSKFWILVIAFRVCVATSRNKCVRFLLQLFGALEFHSPTSSTGHSSNASQAHGGCNLLDHTAAAATLALSTQRFCVSAPVAGMTSMAHLTTDVAGPCQTARGKPAVPAR